MSTSQNNLTDISCSIVLYKNSPALVQAAIDSFLKTTLSKKLFLIDNSPERDLSVLASSADVEYISTGENLGFGKAHNLILKKVIGKSKYHLVLNPDVYFDHNVLEKIYDYMERRPDIGQVMPRICYPNGEIQRLCKLLPTPIDLLLRRFLLWVPGAKRRNDIYELRDTGYDKTMNVPYLSGCFMFFRASALKEVGIFDERFFMYMEDVDLTRRMHLKFKTQYYPAVTAFHSHARESYRLNKLLIVHITSAIKYFAKWGWFFDRTRRKINNETLFNACDTK